MGPRPGAGTGFTYGRALDALLTSFSWGSGLEPLCDKGLETP
jgi:hypothetical protein